jgi:hypothetical protein
VGRGVAVGGVSGSGLWGLSLGFGSGVWVLGFGVRGMGFGAWGLNPQQGLGLGTHHPGPARAGRQGAGHLPCSDSEGANHSGNSGLDSILDVTF